MMWCGCVGVHCLSFSSRGYCSCNLPLSLSLSLLLARFLSLLHSRSRALSLRQKIRHIKLKINEIKAKIRRLHIKEYITEYIALQMLNIGFKQNI